MKRKMKRRLRRASGFTLFEVLLVLVILIILTSTVSVSLLNAQRRANLRAAKAQIGMIENALKLYLVDVGSYPTTDQGLVSLRQQPDGQAKWAGPYAEKDIPNDPWGNPYQYELNGTEVRIWSFGPDGQEGTGDEVSSDASV